MLTPTGINTIIYYTPTVFAQVGLSGGSIGLLATGGVGYLMVVFTIPGMLMVDKVGRKSMPAWGLVNMGIAYALVVALIATYGSNFGEHKSAGNAAILFVHWIVVNTCCLTDLSAGSSPRSHHRLIYVPNESLWNLRVNWIMNFAVAQVTPVMITNIGYKKFIVVCCCVIGLAWVYFVLPELNGLSLEKIDAVFADGISTEDRLRRERIADELGVYNVANAATNAVISDYSGGYPPSKILNWLNARCFQDTRIIILGDYVSLVDAEPGYDYPILGDICPSFVMNII